MNTNYEYHVSTGDHGETVVAGPPGCGKTYYLASVAHMLAAEGRNVVYVCADPSLAGAFPNRSVYINPVWAAQSLGKSVPEAVEEVIKNPEVDVILIDDPRWMAGRDWASVSAHVKRMAKLANELNKPIVFGIQTQGEAVQRLSKDKRKIADTVLEVVAMNEKDREEFFTQLDDHMCPYCYRDKDPEERCHCRNDD